LEKRSTFTIINNIYNHKRNTCEIITNNPDLAREIAYLSILSRMSDKLRTKGLHRIHGLGLESNGKGALILLPSGGGKSTLAMSFLTKSQHRIRLLSEDSPLIGPKGILHPFPLRIGVFPEKIPKHIDESCIRILDRMEFGPKATIDISTFQEHICSNPVPCKAVLLGIRSTGLESSIKSVSRLKSVHHYFMNSVVGVGLYQGMEFMIVNVERFSKVIDIGILAISEGNIPWSRHGRS